MSYKTFDDFLSTLDKVKPIGNGEHEAICPAHNDKSPSLHVKLDTDKILINCKAGCQTVDIVKALGITMSDLFIKNETIKPQLVKTYDYKDANGKVVFQVCRYEPKTFRQRRPDGKGGWTYNLDGVTTCLYNLPYIIDGINDNQPIYIVEGEKDADALGEYGLFTTCNPMGAGKWKSQYTNTLKNAVQIVLIPDNDEAGKKHAKDIYTAIRNEVQSLKIVMLPDGIKDISDYLSQYDFDQFTTLVKNTRTIKVVKRVTKQNGNDLLNMHFDPIKWIVPEMLPQGSTILAGKPKAGKSRMALNIAVSVATGGITLDKIRVEKGDVLYLSLEDSARRLQSHLSEMFFDDNPDLSNIDFWYASKLIGDGCIEELEEWLSNHNNARLIVIDTIKKIRPKDSGGNIYNQDYEAISPLTDLASQYNIAILAVHHTSKRTNADDLMDLVSGSTGLTGAADTSIILERKRSETGGTMHIYGRDTEDRDIALDFTGGWWKWLGNEKQVRMSEERQDIIDLLYDSPELLPKEIATELDKPKVRQLLSKMVRDDQLICINGKYSVNTGVDNENS